MALELKDIYTISLSDYCAVYEVNPSDFYAVGVTYDTVKHGDPHWRDGRDRAISSLFDKFMHRVPDGAVAVVDFRASYGAYNASYSHLEGIISGTALIPKESKE